MKYLSIFFTLILACNESFASPSLILKRVYSYLPAISALNVKSLSKVSPVREQLRLINTSSRSRQGSAWKKVLKNAQYSTQYLGQHDPTPPSIPHDIAEILDISPSESAFAYNIVRNHHTLNVEKRSTDNSDLFNWFETNGPYALKVEIDEQIVISDEYDEITNSLTPMETYLEKHSFVIEKTATGNFHFYQAIKGELTLSEFMNNAELNKTVYGNIEGLNKAVYTEDEIRMILNAYQGLNLKVTMSSV